MNRDSEDTITAEEAALATLAYQEWERSEAESMAEYVHRKRTVDLSTLASDVIEQVLSERERLMVRLFYGEQMLPLEIAEHLHINKSTVTRCLERAEGRIAGYLKYVVQYQHDQRNVTVLPLAIRQAMMFSAIRTKSASTIGERILQMRTAEGIRLSKLAELVGIHPERLSALETNAASPDASEIVRLSAFFDITTDKLLKGE